MIKVKHLFKDYPIDKTTFHALKDINLSFSSGEFVAILGPSGCGKTTFLNLLGGLDAITDGDILFKGESLKTMSSSKLNSYRNNDIGFIFQNYFLIPQFNVLDNVKIALQVRNYKDDVIDKLANDALKRVGISSLAEKKPNELSGGQAQRVAIARALVASPSIILADEPTGALDSKSSIEIMNLLKELFSDKLVIMVTHNDQLAKQYATRIIELKDGEVYSDSKSEKNSEETEVKRSSSNSKERKLPLLTRFKLAFKNLISKKGKTILTGLVNSFGMIGIGFFLAINHGFSLYSDNMSKETVSSLPIVLSSYESKSSSETFNDTNASDAYTDKDEIYPSVSQASQNSYKYNNFSIKYFNYLDSLKEDGIVKDYLISYGNSYSFNLMTEFPDSISTSAKGGISLINTSSTSYNYYAYSSGLPYNIFHMLYGDLDQYDLLEGTLPQSSDELVLVVNKYNAVPFKILQNLGFYNLNDSEDDVKDKSLSTKVKPIKFKDIIGKEYKVFSNDEYYTKVDFDSEANKTDSLGNKRDVTRYLPKYDLTGNDINSFYNGNGKTLKISGIIRAKKTSTMSMLAPSLCFLPSLQYSLVEENSTSQVNTTLANNILFKSPSSTATADEAKEAFVNALNDIMSDYINGKTDIIPTSALNNILDDYFQYRGFKLSSYNDKLTGYTYSGFTSFLNQARQLGVNLIDDDMMKQDLSDNSILNGYLVSIYDNLMSEPETSYRILISLVAALNAYSTVQNVVIFPTTLANRTELLNRLTSFNEIAPNSKDHASSEEEQVFFNKLNDNPILKDVEDMVSLVSVILMIFAVVSLTVSCCMTALMTSNNVLERKKEIGLLRSLGSRKRDITSIFEIEAGFIGLIAGLLGSLVTYVLSFPINHIIDYYYPSYNASNICSLTYYHVLIIIAISIFIVLLSAFIPAFKASRESPVKCLRSE